MTDKIYHRDAYLRELDAEVVRTEGNTAVFAATISRRKRAVSHAIWER